MTNTKVTTPLKIMLETDYVSHYKIHSNPVAENLYASNEVFDLDDIEPLQKLDFGNGKVSIDNTEYEEVEILSYENFVKKCVKPSSFLQGRKRCDYILLHPSTNGYALLIELTSSKESIANLRKPIEKNGKIQFIGGKFEKCETQLFQSLKDLLEVSSINSAFSKQSKRMCLMAYKIEKTNVDNVETNIIKRPFQRYLSVESNITKENGAIIPCESIESLGFEYRRINHDFTFKLK